MLDGSPVAQGADSASEDLSDRYSRQIRFAPIGPSGQRALEAATVLVVGCGALGASLAQHMARSGVGRLRIVDRDYVEPSNLQRQTLFGEDDASATLPKAVAAAEKLGRINSSIEIEGYVAHVGPANVRQFAAGADLVLDGTDNAETRLLLSDICFELGIPFVYGGVTGSQGMSAMLVPGTTACLRCIIGGEEEALEEGESCDTAGVLAAAVEFVVSLQAIEAIKWLTGNRDAVRGTWINADLWRFGIREARLPAGASHCRHCGEGRRGAAGSFSSAAPPAAASSSATDLAGSGGMRSAARDIAVLCGRDTVQVTLGRALPLQRVGDALRAKGCELTVNRYLVKARLTGGERLVLFPDGRVLVQGTTDTERALRLCELYVNCDTGAVEKA